MKRRELLSTLAAVAATASLGWLWQHKRGSGADRHDIGQTVFASPLPPLTPWHLQLIRKLRVTWVPIESGAPGIDPLQPLRGELSSLGTLLLAEICLWIPEFVACKPAHSSMQD